MVSFCVTTQIASRTTSMEEQMSPRASLLLGSDDTETLEAALTFIEECSPSATGSVRSLLALDASATVDSSQGFELAKGINPQFQGTPTSSDIVPSDTPAVFERLMTESHEVYTGIDEFLNARRQQRLNGNTFFEHSDAKTLPFERHLVEQAMWRALGYRVIRRQTNFYRDHVEATDDTISSCAHMVIRYEDLGVYIQLRLAGRKYREENRTIIVMRALVEPKGLDNRAPLGLAFQETHVRVVTPRFPAVGGPGIAATTVETHVSVTQHLPGNWTRQFWREWSDDSIARSMWNQAITARMLVIEDQLFDEARKTSRQ
ncbi:hypothetical protein BBJ28_00014981 [Nothophytophthora sp. Chile5]|nr:hypothetical protein BBJ28_00014981 [Nothophytophthora sp. Chile5]